MSTLAAKRTRYEKSEVAFGQIKVNSNTPDIVIGDTAVFDQIPSKEIIEARFVTDAGNELDLFVGDNATNTPVTFTVDKATTLINYVVSYIRGTGHPSAGNANSGQTGTKLALNVLSTAPAVTYPIAATKTTTTATLKGSVQPQGAATTVVFEYGTTTGYGTTVAAAQSPIVAGTTAVTPVTAAITGLTTGTTYHFRVKATNASGVTNGADQTVITD
jgi:hypothetical protein